MLVCKRCELGEKICYNSRDIKFFLGDYFFGAPCTLFLHLLLIVHLAPLAESICETVRAVVCFATVSLTVRKNLESKEDRRKSPSLQKSDAETKSDDSGCEGRILCNSWWWTGQLTHTFVDYSPCLVFCYFDSLLFSVYIVGTRVIQLIL